MTFTDFTTIRLDRILLVTDVTNNTVIYQFNNSSLGGTVGTNVLTLTYNTNTAGFNNSDALQVFYDSAVGDPTYDSPSVTGNVAHDAVDSGNPLKIGGKAYASVPTAVSDADRVNAYFDTYGRQHTAVDTLPDITVVTPTVHYAVINRATSGDGTAIVAADATHTIVVMSYVIISAGAVNATWKQGSTAVSGALPLAANTGASATSSLGLFATATNAALYLNLDGNVQVSGHLAYILV